MKNVEKKPWEMTKAEAGRNALLHDLAQAKLSLKKIPNSDLLAGYVAGLENTLATGGKATAKGHYYQVRYAVKNGENVPAEVLADYPDLANKPTNPGTGM